MTHHPRDTVAPSQPALWLRPAATALGASANVGNTCQHQRRFRRSGVYTALTNEKKGANRLESGFVYKKAILGSRKKTETLRLTVVKTLLSVSYRVATFCSLLSFRSRLRRRSWVTHLYTVYSGMPNYVVTTMKHCASRTASTSVTKRGIQVLDKDRTRAKL